MKTYYLILIAHFFLSQLVFAEGFDSWRGTKKAARDQVYFDHQITFYCECSYIPSGSSGGQIDQATCDYSTGGQSHAKRAERLEWEHIVPASLMPARQFKCWNEGLPACGKGGRACCEKHDPVAREMIFDLYNLVPSIGQVNAVRSNSRYGIISGEDRKLGQCDFEWSRGTSEPPESKLGNVARIWLYMHKQYGLEFIDDELEMFQRWNQGDPPTQWEIERGKRIAKIQGNSNPFLSKAKVSDDKERGSVTEDGDSTAAESISPEREIINLVEEPEFIENPFEEEYSGEGDEADSDAY